MKRSKRNLWLSNTWEDYFKIKPIRAGLRVKFDKGINYEVKMACKAFAKWLRRYYYFPIRVPIYFKNKKMLKSSVGKMCSATFFGPYNKNVEPYIRISVGDYNDMVRKRGKINAIYAILCSITHELSHYYQWIKAREGFDDEEYNYSERQALYYSKAIASDYYNDLYERGVLYQYINDLGNHNADSVRLNKN